eukprot:2045663-Pyramimonas_sp.AAC.1
MTPAVIDELRDSDTDVDDLVSFDFSPCTPLPTPGTPLPTVATPQHAGRSHDLYDCDWEGPTPIEVRTQSPVS